MCCASHHNILNRISYTKYVKLYSQLISFVLCSQKNLHFKYQYPLYLADNSLWLNYWIKSNTKINLSSPAIFYILLSAKINGLNHFYNIKKDSSYNVIAIPLEIFLICLHGWNLVIGFVSVSCGGVDTKFLLLMHHFSDNLI